MRRGQDITAESDEELFGVDSTEIVEPFKVREMPPFWTDSFGYIPLQHILIRYLKDMTNLAIESSNSQEAGNAGVTVAEALEHVQRNETGSLHR